MKKINQKETFFCPFEMRIGMQLLHTNSTDVYLWLETNPQVPPVPASLFPPVSPSEYYGKRKVVSACPVTGAGLFVNRGCVCFA